MSRSKDPSNITLVSEMRQMIEDTIDRVQKNPDMKPGTAPSFPRARATKHVTVRARARSLDPMNEYEQTSVRALMVWAANEQHSSPETVKAVTEVRFGVADVADLQRRDYEDVIRFLIDLRIDEMKN